MYHASVPLNADGSLKEVEIRGKKYKGIALMKKTGHIVREAFNADTPDDEKQFAVDYIWYLSAISSRTRQYTQKKRDTTTDTTTTRRS